MNVSPGQLARVVAPFHLAGRGAFVIVRRAYRGEQWIGDTHWPRFCGPAWICEGFVRYVDTFGRQIVIGPAVVLSDACLIPVVGLNRPDSRDLTVPQQRRPA